MPAKLQPSLDTLSLVSFLLDAEEDADRILDALKQAENTAYLILQREVPIGAVLMHWQPDASEILYIAVAAQWRGRGYGKSALLELIEIGKRRRTKALLVGTANSSLDNLAFYQKSGFRMDSVRKDHFNYLTEPVYENGIRMIDMLVLRYEITAPT